MEVNGNPSGDRVMSSVLFIVGLVMVSTILQLSTAGAVSVLLRLACAESWSGRGRFLTLNSLTVIFSGRQWISVTGSHHFRHSPRAARSCRSSCGRRGRPGRSGPAGTPASASVSGHGC